MSTLHQTVVTMQQLGAVKPTTLAQVVNEHATHYAINFGESPIVVNTYGYTLINRGILFPIDKYTTWDMNANWDTQGQIIHHQNGMILREFSPGVIAEFLQRQYEDQGLIVLHVMTAVNDKDLIQSFLDLCVWPDKSTPTKFIPITNNQILEVLSEHQAKTEEDSLPYKIFQALVDGISKAQDGIYEALARKRQSIKMGQSPMLDRKEIRMCIVGDLPVSDYEISGDAHRLAVQDVYGQLKKAQNKPIDSSLISVEIARENEALKARNNALELELAKTNAKLDGVVNEMRAFMLGQQRLQQQAQQPPAQSVVEPTVTPAPAAVNKPGPAQPAQPAKPPKPPNG